MQQTTDSVGRTRGVRVPEQQQLNRTTGHPPNTVIGFSKSDMYAIEYTDDAGRSHREVVLVVGTAPNQVVYLTPGGERWASELKTANKNLTNKVLGLVNPTQIADIDVLDGNQASP